MEQEAGTGRQLTLGEQRVRLSFNPSGNTQVDKIKAAVACLIDDLDAMKDAEPQSEKNRCLSIAQTDLETAAMYAVKAATTK